MADEGKSLIEIKLEKEAAEAEAVRESMYKEAPAEAETPNPDGEETPPGDQHEEVPGETGAPAAEETPNAEEVEDEAAKKKDKDTFEQKYLTLKGKYDKELPKAAADLKLIRVELKKWQDYAASLEGKIAELNEKLKAKAPPAEEPEKKTGKPKVDLADPELSTLLADYPGAGKILEAFEAQRKADEETIKGLLAKIESSGSKFEKIETDVKESKSVGFERDMIALVGKDWRSTDADPKFLEWLGEEIPYTGKTKLTLLQAAVAALDATTVARFFNDYLATREDPPAEEETPGEDTGAPAEDAEGKLKKQLAPPRSGGAPRKNGAVKAGTYTRKQYEQFMNETINGKFKPENWGGKTEVEMNAIFDLAIARHELA